MKPKLFSIMAAASFLNDLFNSSKFGRIYFRNVTMSFLSFPREFLGFIFLKARCSKGSRGKSGSKRKNFKYFEPTRRNEIDLVVIEVVKGRQVEIDVNQDQMHQKGEAEEDCSNSTRSRIEAKIPPKTSGGTRRIGEGKDR